MLQVHTVNKNYNTYCCCFTNDVSLESAYNNIECKKTHTRTKSNTFIPDNIPTKF